MKVRFSDLKFKNGETVATCAQRCLAGECNNCPMDDNDECYIMPVMAEDDYKLEKLNYEFEIPETRTFTKVYICSPYRGDTKKNIAAAVEYCRYAIDKGVIPIAPHIYFTQFLNDDIPEQREFGLQIGLEAMEECSEVWVFGDYISEGMKQEIEAATAAGQKVVFKHIPAAAESEDESDGQGTSGD